MCKMFHQTMKGDGVEWATLELRLDRSIWIIRKLDVDHIILMLGMSRGHLIVYVVELRRCLLVSRHTNSNCHLLFCLVRQYRLFFGRFVADWVNVRVGVHPLIVRGGSSRGDHRGVSGRVVRIWRVSPSYLGVVGRDSSCLNVHPYILLCGHSW